MLDLLIRLIKKKALVLGVFFLFFLWALSQVSDLSFDHDRKRFFPNGDSSLAFTNQFMDEIEADDIFILVGVEWPSSILDQSNRISQDLLHERLKALDGIEEVMGLGQFKALKKAGPKLYEVNLLSSDLTQRADDSSRIVKHPLVYEQLVSSDFSKTLFLLRTKDITHQEQADSIYNGLLEALTHFPELTFHLGGYPIIQSVSVGLLGQEMRFYVVFCCLLLLAALFIIYRSFWALIVPICSLVLGMCFFFYYIHASGQHLDLMSSLFPILLLIFVMADVVHLQTHFVDRLKVTGHPVEAMKVSLKEIGTALFLTSFTTAVGFAALYFSKIEAIREFGLNAAMGVILAYLLVLFFASSLLLVIHKNLAKSQKLKPRNWHSLLAALHQMNLKKRKTIVFTLLGLLLITVFGIMQISTNTLMSDDLPKNSAIRSDYSFFENHFGGVRSFELALLPQNELKLYDAEVMLQIEKLSLYLRDSQKMRQIIDPNIPYRMLHHAYSRGRSDYELPSSIEQLRRYAAKRTFIPHESLKTIQNASGTLGRISARQNDHGTNYHAEQTQVIEKWAGQNLDSTLLTVRPVGTTLMYDHNHTYLRQSLFRSLGLALCIVALLFALLFKDVKMLWISIIPNLIPLLLAAAVMGFLEIKLYALTSIFFAISFGIAVDDTIHFLTRFKLERKKGKSVEEAIEQTFLISGKALVITSILLVSAFISLAFSDFRGTSYIGILVSSTLVFALLADFFLLPQLLYFFYGKKDKQAKSSTADLPKVK